MPTRDLVRELDGAVVRAVVDDEPSLRRAASASPGSRSSAARFARSSRTGVTTAYVSAGSPREDDRVVAAPGGQRPRDVRAEPHLEHEDREQEMDVAGLDPPTVVGDEPAHRVPVEELRVARALVE